MNKADMSTKKKKLQSINNFNDKSLSQRNKTRLISNFLFDFCLLIKVTAGIG